MQKVYPHYKLRQSETQLSDYYIVTERLIQEMTALTPESLWFKAEESGNPNKTYTYSAKAKCLKDFQDVFHKAKDEKPENNRYRELYKFYLAIAPKPTTRCIDLSPLPLIPEYFFHFSCNTSLVI